MPQSPPVSVLIDNYNYGRFLGQCLESVIAQTYPNVEIIVVDDGSKDNSRDVIASFGDKVTPILQENHGQASTLNAGFTLSKGEWIFLLDSDDFFHPDKIRQLMALAAEYPDAGMIAHDLSYCTVDGQPLDFAAPYIPKRTLVDDRKLAQRGSLSVSLPAHSGLCFRRDVFEYLLPLPEDINMGIDNYMKWAVLSRYPVLLTPELLTTQRIHGSNAGTMLQEAGGTEGLIKLARQSARTSFHINRDFPHLKRLTWKQYGRTLYHLRASRSAQSKAIEKEIRDRYSVFENNPACLFYVAGAFAKAYAENLFAKK